MILSFEEWPSGRPSKPQPWPGVAAAFLYSSETPDSHPGEGRSADLCALILFLVPSSAKELHAHLDSFRQAI